MNSTSQLPEGATPLDPSESEGLKPGLLTVAELNTFEQTNIAQAIDWAKRSRKLKKNLFSVESMKLIHRQMFNDTWKWAGKFRLSGKNIGVEPHLIQEQLKTLCGDGDYWIKNETYSIDICAVRFHHRLVSIHPFPNGNGRHARLVADLIMHFNNESPFTWGGSSIDIDGTTRENYLAALRSADKGNYTLLINFAKQA